MAAFPEFTNQGIPSDGNPGPFPPFGNVGAPYMATLSLPGLTVGLPVWLFSTSVVPNVSTTVQSVPPPEQHHVDSKVDLSPSLPISASSSSTSPGESLDLSNQVAKNKNKKSDKGEASSAAIAPKKSSIDKPFDPPRKVKFPCMLCTGDHLLRDCPGIPKVLEAWSNSRPPLSLTSGSKVGGTSSTRVGKTPKKQGKITNPCRLCDGHHAIHLCPYMDEAKRVLDNSTISTPCLSIGYKQISSSPPPADPTIGQESSWSIPLPRKFKFRNPFPTNHWSWDRLS